MNRDFDEDLGQLICLVSKYRFYAENNWDMHKTDEFVGDCLSV